MVDEQLDKANRYVYTYGSRVRSAMKIDEMARIASDGTEDLSKMRWQFSVLIKRHARLGKTTPAKRRAIAVDKVVWGALLAFLLVFHLTITPFSDLSTLLSSGAAFEQGHVDLETQVCNLFCPVLVSIL